MIVDIVLPVYLHIHFCKSYDALHFLEKKSQKLVHLTMALFALENFRIKSGIFHVFSLSRNSQHRNTYSSEITCK